LDRCALFVDANYALAEGALVVHGTRNRDSVSWDYAGILKLLGSLSRDRTGLPLLRCYWYDTAADGARAAEHEALADIPGVKLRLSKARPSRKEGVEAEIRKDLTALARNHAVSDVIIVSAEEDLAPVIAEVQDLGIRTVLFHLATDVGWAMTRTLRQECDDIIEIGAAHLRPYVDLISGAEPQLPAAGFRELAGSAVLVSGPHAAIEAPSVRLYDTPMTGEYEHASLAGPGQAQAHRHDPRRFGSSESLNSAPMAGGGDNQPVLPGAQPVQGRGPSHDQPIAYAQAAQMPMPPAAASHPSPDRMAPAQAAQPPVGQAPPGYPAHAQHAPGLQAPAQHGQSQQPLGTAGLAQRYQPADRGRPQPQAGSDAGFEAARFGDQDNRSTLGQPRHQQSTGFDQRGADDGRGQPGSLGQPGREALNGAGPNGLGRGEHGYQEFGQAQFGGNGIGVPPGGASSASVMPPNGASANGVSSGPGVMPGPARHGAAGQPGLSGTQHLDASLGQPGYGQLGAGQAARAASQQPGSQATPPSNGRPYAQDRSMPYSGSGQPAQFSGPGAPAAYGRDGYGGQHSAVAPVAISVGDAVQSAHAEGFGFGEAVARDAPALWLEAVLARKPRMPSDLEARLLQGSALPIDSLLHDEVRHALRRGFWDALERSRH